jgi:transposase
VIHIGVRSDAGATAGKPVDLSRMKLSADDLPDDIIALKAMLLTSRAVAATLTAANDKLEAENAALANENLRFKTQNERFADILRVLRRAHFGRSSEKISDDQLNLALDDVQTGFAVENAKAEKANEAVKRDATKARRANRGDLPAHLPREEIVIEPGVTKTGADEVAGIVQAPAPARLIEGGIPTEARIADVLVSQYADHTPLYRQSQIARLARRHAHQARQRLARVQDRRTHALGLRQDPQLTSQREAGAALTF